MKKDIKYNNQITNDYVRIIADKVVVKTTTRAEALDLATSSNLDLIQISEQVIDGKQYSICVIQDIDKYIYAQNKKHKKETKQVVKEFKFSIKTDMGDLSRKLEQIINALHQNSSAILVIRKNRGHDPEPRITFLKNFFTEQDIVFSVSKENEKNMRINLSYKKNKSSNKIKKEKDEQ